MAILEDELAGAGAAHAELVELLGGGEARARALDDERRDSLRACGRIRLRIDHEHVRVGPIGDPHLAAVEDVAVALPLRTQLHGDDIRAGAGLRHRERSDVLAVQQPGKEARALLVVAIQADLVHAQVGMGAVGEAHRAGGARDLLHDERVCQVAEAGASPALRNGDAEQALRAERRPQVARKLVLAVDVGCPRRDLLRREPPHLIPDLDEGLAEVEITVADCRGGHVLAFQFGWIV